MRKAPAKAAAKNTDAVRLWAAHNRGIQTKIASEVKPAVTTQFVHHVLFGRRKSKGGLIEKKLRQAGAPI